MKREWFELNNDNKWWHPCCWQGWLITIIYIFLVILIPAMLEKAPISTSDKLLLILMSIFVLTVIFALITYLKGKKFP